LQECCKRAGRFLSLLEAEDGTIEVRRGRIENQKTKNPVYGPALDLIGKYEWFADGGG